MPELDDDVTVIVVVVELTDDWAGPELEELVTVADDAPPVLSPPVPGPSESSEMSRLPQAGPMTRRAESQTKVTRVCAFMGASIPAYFRRASRFGAV
jgi:hypothetical protein